jgi:hypothetical protein
MLDYQLMQLVPEVVSTGGTPVAVIDPEEGAAGPVGGLLEFRLDDIQNDRYSILIVISNDSLMCVRCVRGHYTVSLTCKLGRLVGLNESYD